jgi:erythritol transport system permease protein
VLLNAIQYRRRVKRPTPTAGQPTSPLGGGNA